MAKESVIIRIIKGSCLSVGLHVENTYRKTDMLLKLYRKVNWSIGNKIEDLKMVAYDNCMGDTEFFSYLLNFAPEKELEIFRIRAVNVIQTKLLIDLIDRAVQRIREYPDDGKTYHSILDLKYMNFLNTQRTKY